jgi:hypothetical protein
MAVIVIAVYSTYICEKCGCKGEQAICGMESWGAVKSRNTFIE